MRTYAVIMLLIAVLLAALGIAVYRGRTELIHRYHQTKVTDKAAYGKAFGRALLAVAAVLAVGTGIGMGCIAAVQKKYNNGMF